jgi:predicted O-linked N-acetylglucosamine transferase (SPINDLY family)
MIATTATSAATHGRAHAFWQRGVESAGRAEWRAAALAFRRAVRAAPADALYWVNLANAYRHGGDPVRAADAAERALALEPEHPLALRLLGESLGTLHRYAEAVGVYERLEASGVREPDAMLAHASNLQALRRPLQAIDVLMQAAAIEPTLMQLHALMATAFRDMALQREAIECLKTVLALEPGNVQAQAHLSYEKRHLCDWVELDADVQRLTHALATQPEGLARVASAFSLLSLPIDPVLQLAAARAESNTAMLGARELPGVAPAMRRARGGPLRLAMLSYDFHEHPVSQLVVEMLEKLDRDRIALTLYSTGRDDGSALRARVIAAADHFVDLRGVSDAMAAERIRADGIDILVDLQGHTRGHRMPILARRPAPLQVAWLGYPASTGAPFIDYLIGDPFATPLSLAAQYTEKLAQMPLTLQPNGRWRPLPQPMSRAAAGLPEGAFVICAFNHTYKILPVAFDVWCAVMREMPHAVLWLKETNAQLHANVQREAAARGVGSERIVFAKPVSYADHFSRLAQADVFVDTWPYNAHTTAADALWAGVPVLTVYGNAYASRVAASVLNAAGLGELAFDSVDDYRLAILALAREPQLLAEYRRHLSEKRLSLPLFDTDRYTREFEALLGRMWQRWLTGQGPEHLPAA